MGRLLASGAVKNKRLNRQLYMIALADLPEPERQQELGITRIISDEVNARPLRIAPEPRTLAS